MIEWCDDYATGDEKIDSQHKQLFKFINRLTENIQAGKPVNAQDINIGFLEEYAKYHFCYEESCMEFYQCPTAQANKEAHQNFLEYYQTLAARIKKEGINAVNVAELQYFLENWLASHIMRIDAKMKPCIEKL